jgi:hypothetical protein
LLHGDEIPLSTSLVVLFFITTNLSAAEALTSLALPPNALQLGIPSATYNLPLKNFISRRAIKFTL